MSVYVSSSEFVHFIFIWFPSLLNFIVPLSILFIRFSLSVQLLSSPSFTISPSMLVFSHFFLIHSFRLSFFLCPSFMLMGIAVVPLLHFPYISFFIPSPLFLSLALLFAFHDNSILGFWHKSLSSFVRGPPFTVRFPVMCCCFCLSCNL